MTSAADMALGKEPVRVDGRFFCRVLTFCRVSDMWHSAKKPLPMGSLLSAIGALLRARL
jgi:hypothetical protein